MCGTDTDRRFLLDVMCGKLAVYLRMCGHDAAYAGDRNVTDDDRLLVIADAENRTLLTRDRELAGRTEDALLLAGTETTEQLRELADSGIPLELDDAPAHCGRCNGRVDAVDPESKTPAYAPDPAAVDCFRCRSCGQVFWKGSHWNRVERTLEDV
ncbi:MAG: Mut7-C RNAse domain-containing protein [Natronomonas sp.]